MTYNFFSYGILQRHCKKMAMKCSFSYNSFVKLSLYNMIHSYGPQYSFTGDKNYTRLLVIMSEI